MRNLDLKSDCLGLSPSSATWEWQNTEKVTYLFCAFISLSAKWDSPSWITALPWRRGLHNAMKLWAMPCRATQDRWVIVESSDKMIKLPAFVESQRKQENSRKTSTDSLTVLKPLTVWITTNGGIFLQRWEYQTTSPISWEHVCRSRSNSWNRTWIDWLGSKLGKEYVKAVYYHLVYLTSMQSTSCKMPGWINHKLKSRLLGEISTTSDMQMRASVLSHFSHVWFCDPMNSSTSAPCVIGFSRQE